MLTGWTLADPLLSVIVALLIVYAAWGLIAKSAHILLEGAPDGVDPDEIKRRLVAEVDGVKDVHHFHAWSLTNELPVVTMHAAIEEHADADQILIDLHKTLESVFGLGHATIQIERGECPDIDYQP